MGIVAFPLVSDFAPSPTKLPLELHFEQFCLYFMGRTSGCDWPVQFREQKLAWWGKIWIKNRRNCPVKQQSSPGEASKETETAYKIKKWNKYHNDDNNKNPTLLRMFWEKDLYT